MNVRGLCVVLLLLFLITSKPFSGSYPDSQETWLKSQDVSIELAAWHRCGKSDRVLATFVVTTPKKAEVTNSLTVDPSTEFTTRFPDDFGTYLEAGDYAWHCKVQGQVVASGRFRFEYQSGRRCLYLLDP